ncbi:hypothetical protein RJP21_18935 [Paenibacillus sp. VCA1]|uniref:hypothetical protein n=1 Tax=Paenibacillus sp. VCA1 TaxID=3039148 RepID=UPI002870C075|nr:hypothetical protein [Paenibacillus sp. VCA1]MDR9855693.1 hypothetical protein [Paenibacillus sp. VCA1]
MKRLVVFATTAAMTATLLVIGVSAFADNVVSHVPSLTPSVTAQNKSEITPPAITPYDTKNPIYNTQLRDGVKPAFLIDTGYGWVKVWVKNDTNEEMIVRVTKESLTGQEKMMFTVPAHGQLAVPGNKAWSTGTFYVAITTRNSVPLSGLLSVKLATASAGL